MFHAEAQRRKSISGPRLQRGLIYFRICNALLCSAPLTVIVVIITKSWTSEEFERHLGFVGEDGSLVETPTKKKFF